MRRIYTILLYLLLPFIVLRLYWKGRRLSAYRQRIRERFSVKACENFPIDVWLHAVSLGEVVAAAPLINALLARDMRVLVTTMTPTGSAEVINRFANRVVHQYIPYDLPWVLRRFFKTINAKVGIIMETELWPNLIHEAHQSKLPLVLANARISDKAFRQYHQVRCFFKPILSKFSAILAQSEQDAERYIALGAPRGLVKALGNMKFDIQLNSSKNPIAHSLKKAWGEPRTVIMAASTHDDEERQILACFKTLQDAIPGVVLIITPRHPERFDAVYTLSQAHGFKSTRRSQFEQVNHECEILILDSMGELLSFYEITDYAFVGGSLVPIGGHNVLEPIAMNVPVFCGPYMQNSKAICEALCKEHALVQVEHADELIKAIITMHQDLNLRASQTVNATRVLIENRGSVSRHVHEIYRALNDKPESN